MGWCPGPTDRLELIQPISGVTLQACEKAAARAGECLVDRLAGLRADRGERDKREQRREEKTFSHAVPQNVSEVCSLNCIVLLRLLIA